MSTYTAIHLETSNQEIVHRYFTAWLKGLHPDWQIESTDGIFPNDFYDGPHFIPDSIPPTRVLLAMTQPDWVTVFYNSFHEMQEPAEELSKQIGSTAIVVIAQSVSEAYFVMVYQAGKHLRTLEYAGDTGDWLKQEGSPFPFESEPLGTNISDSDDETLYIFGRQETSSFCKALGLEVWKEDDNLVWNEVKVVPPKIEIPKKPQWQFWK